MSDLERWKRDADLFGWKLPKPASLLLRLPIVRNVRYIAKSFMIEMHYARCRIFGLMGRSGYDEWVLFAISKGMV